MFLGDDRFRPLGTSGSRHDFDTSARHQTRRSRLPSHQLPRDFDRRFAAGIRKADGIPVHHRPIKRRIVAVGPHVFRQTKPNGVQQRDRSRRGRLRRLQHHSQGFVGRNQGR